MSGQFKALSDEDFEKLSIYKTHFTRFSNLILKINQHEVSIKNLNQRVVNTLAYYGYDLEAQDFIDEHNRVSAAINEDLKDLHDAAVALNDDLKKIIEDELKNVDKSISMLKNAERISSSILKENKGKE